MAAPLMGKEELAVALELAFVEVNLVTVIISMERDVEFVEAKSFALLGIALGFLDLADHAIIHLSVSFQWLEIKRHARGRMPWIISWKYRCVLQLA
jgi:hypothetical protein